MIFVDYCVVSKIQTKITKKQNTTIGQKWDIYRNRRALQPTISAIATMEQQKIVTVSWNGNKVFGKSNVRPSFEKCYLTGLYGRRLIHASQLAHEHLQHCCWQHCIVVYLKSEANSLRDDNAIKANNASMSEIAIIPAHTNYWQKTKSEVSEVIILAIEPDLLSRLAREKIQSNSIELKPTLEQTDVLVQSIALNLKMELDSLTSDRIYMESLFQTLLMHLIKNYCDRADYPQRTAGNLPPYRLKQAIDYIERHLDENIKIKDVARSIGISQYYFCRLFRQSTGISPYRYIIQQRILKAKTLIEENRLSLSDIALECGFSSQSQMTHHFRKLVNTTPKVYRDRLSN